MKMTQSLINKLAKFFNVRDFKKSNNIKIRSEPYINTLKY